MSRRGSWTRRREFAARAEMAAGLLAALVLAGVERAWWLRAMFASALATGAGACLVIAVLLLAADEYPSAGLAAVVAVGSGLGWLVVRPSARGGAPR